MNIRSDINIIIYITPDHSATEK